MPVEIKLRPIHEEMLEVARLFQKRHFARWIFGTGADFYGPIYRGFEAANLEIYPAAISVIPPDDFLAFPPTLAFSNRRAIEHAAARSREEGERFFLPGK